jgi:hypothetical protein
MLQAADLTYPEIAVHMDLYLRSGYRTRRMWTICIPARSSQGEEWREVLQLSWLSACERFGAKDWQLMVEDLAIMPPDKVLVLVGVKRVQQVGRFTGW